MTDLTVAATVEPLLEPELLARLERLQLGSKRPLAGRFTGEHRSRRRGSSLDFADYREYHPGDDFRRIDYQLLARLDVLLLKLYEAEDDLTLRLLVDTSASMGVDGKLRAAARAAAALGFVALTRRDVVSLHTFPLDRPAPRFLGRGAVPALFDSLAGLDADGPTTFAAATAQLLSRPGPVGMTVVMSDLLTPEWEQGIRRLPSLGADLAVVHVLSPEELSPTLSGDLELVDRETDATVPVSLSVSSGDDYADHARQWADDVALRCRRAGAAYVRLMSDADIEDALLRVWRTSGLLR